MNDYKTDKWEMIDIDNAENIGILELESGNYFEVVKTDKHLVFGNSTNIGLLQSGYMLIDDYFSIDENLQALLENLEIFYIDGVRYCDNLVCNDRM